MTSKKIGKDSLKVVIHYGVPGMKWGIRKSKEIGSSVINRIKKIQENDAFYRERLKVLERSELARGTSDQRRFSYGSKPLFNRFLRSALPQVKNAVVTNIVRIALGKKITPISVQKDLARAGVNTALDFAKNEILTKSASTRYSIDQESGVINKKTKGSPSKSDSAVDLTFKSWSREDYVEFTYAVAKRITETNIGSIPSDIRTRMRNSDIFKTTENNGG